MSRAAVFLARDRKMASIPKGRLLETEHDVLSFLGGSEPVIVEYGPLADWVEELCKARGDIFVDLESQSELSHLPSGLRGYVALLPWSGGRLIESLVLDDGGESPSILFSRRCMEWTVEARGKGPKWIVPEGCLAPGETGIGVSESHSQNVKRELASLALPRLMHDLEQWGASLWLPFMSFQLIARSKRLQSRQIELALRVALGHIGHRASWHPWDKDFPKGLRGVPLDWLIQFADTSSLARIIGVLKPLGLTHIGHLSVLHPGLQDALRKVTTVEWMRLYECFARSGL